MSWTRSQGRMSTRSAHRFLFLPVAFVVVTLAAIPAAQAADGCTYDPGTLTVSVSVSGLSTGPPDNVLRVDPGGGIQFEGASCGGTVTSTDTILVIGSSGTDRAFVIDLGGGPFAPGATPEADGSPEIEIQVDLGAGVDDLLVVWGTASADSFVAGQQGIDVNGDLDGEVLVSGAEDRALVGFGGNDSLQARGGGGLGGPLVATITLFGLDGRDRLVGGKAGDLLGGGAGDDTLAAGPGKDVLVGGAGNDLLKGQGGNDLILGGPGDDRLAGGSGIDRCRQGPGTGRGGSTCER